MGSGVRMMPDSDPRHEAFASFVAGLCERHPPRKGASRDDQAYRRTATWYAAKGYIDPAILHGIAGGLPKDELMTGYALIYG